MHSSLVHAPDRRRFLNRLALATAFFAVPGAYARALRLTPTQTEGPFYPDRLPLDTDNDLLVLNDALTPAAGTVTWLSGRILDSRGKPIRNATVEIWQCDANGAYLHSGSDQRDRRDAHFQGFGRFVTGSDGGYLFRTIRPVPYPGRTPHIHFAVKSKGREKFTTQCYVRGEPRNAADGIWSSVKDPRQRDAITVPFVPLRGSKAGELTARFDVVLGVAPEM
ncbi:MAG: intradiol ring-cleavage dioxygenase [Verrucomicrobiales bacterium]|nr:intradiol ring-cleavage dioxygenase [Verrucomicrobiales bacterium]